MIWGYTSILVAVTTLTLFTLTEDDHYLLLWWALPIIGNILTYLQLRNLPKRVKTYIDKSIKNIWITIGIVAVVFQIVGIFSWIANFMIIPFEALLLSTGVILTGLTLKFKTLTICGFLSLALRNCLNLLTKLFKSSFCLCFYSEKSSFSPLKSDFQNKNRGKKSLKERDS